VNFGSSFTPVNFTISTSKHDLTIGRTKLTCTPTPSPDIDCEWFNGHLDELRFSKGLVVDQDLLGKVGAAYWTVAGKSVVSSAPAACQKLVTLTARKGVISDGTKKGQEYPNGQACDWLIDQSGLANGATDESALTFIALSFTRFATEPGGDVVRVYDGATESAPLLGELSGYDVPAHIPLISSGNKMLVRFVTDSRQLGPQDGWEAKYVAVSLGSTRCATVNEGSILNLTCPSNQVMTKVNFASYGTPLGFCSNGAGPGVGNLTDASGFLFNDISNPAGVGDASKAGAGANALNNQGAGAILFSTGYCHSNRSISVAKTLCVNKNSCSINASDLTFGGDPCPTMTDSKMGSKGVDDAAVMGSDGFPRNATPYFGAASKRLVVQVTCEGKTSFAANCFDECAERGKCMYGMAAPHCSWCRTQGLQRKADGGYYGMGCGSAYCVKEAPCGKVQETPAPAPAPAPKQQK
jgi:hypothetical protein